MNYGFIITRHVKSNNTNKYWNECVYLIRKNYPKREIVIIDDNSKKEFLKDTHNIDNIRIIESEFKGAGEILPYYYLHKYRLFPSAVIIHDSVFINTRINFEFLKDIAVIPLWHFDNKENTSRAIELTKYIKNNNAIRKKLRNDTIETLGFQNSPSWKGCFGVQSYISLDFLDNIQAKYDLFKIIPFITNREDRCCLERILGVIFFSEYKYLSNTHSLFGDIWKHQVWGITYDEYKMSKMYATHPIVKVWTGR